MKSIFSVVGLLLPVLAHANGSPMDLSQHWVGIASLVIFLLAYLLVIFEEQLHLRKSKPVLLAAGLIWVLIAVACRMQGQPELVEQAIRHSFHEYAELFFFLLVAMTYTNALTERGVFDALRHWLQRMGISYRQLFWMTGVIAFFMSSIANNLTTAMIMCAVILAVGADKPRFVSLSCINIVVAANAGGAFSPFGDITTLMVWQKGVLAFGEFFQLFLPAVVNFTVPALLMTPALPAGQPEAENDDKAIMKPGGKVVIALFLVTIVTAVIFHVLLNIPPVFGMMMGLAFLKLFGFYLRMNAVVPMSNAMSPVGNAVADEFDIFKKVAKAEWDTLFFFYGVMMSVGGLAFLGYLALLSELMYNQLGVMPANILVGILSAIVDNIPVMFAVLTMNPQMDQVQWLLVTLTAGVGGSLLSIGSAAGVALMGQARGYYSFGAHLRWLPVILLGYVASIGMHLWLFS